MFDTFDDTHKKYIIIESNDDEVLVTKQQLYEFYIFNTHGITQPFEDMVRMLDQGQVVTGEDTEFDWDMGCTVYKGVLKIKATSGLPKGAILAPPVIKTGCSHPNKYINTAGFSKFWVCPDCKKDLGDVK